ncbi:hypothetical protein EDD15DRAFT_2201533 [Pisolithus albus]|nr:hypothetical protein EDD15DRAFT_2201533 [Pisolithus albus]
MDGPGVGTMAIPRNSWTGPSKVSGDMMMRRTKDALALAAIAVHRGRSWQCGKLSQGILISGTSSAIRALVPRKVNAARAGIAASSLGGSRLVVLGAICRGNIFPWGPYAAQSSHGALVPRKVNVAGAGIAASSLSGYLLAVLEATYSLGVHVPRKVNAAGASSAASFLRGSALAALRATCNTTLTHLLPKVAPQLISLGIHVPCKVSAAGAGSLMQLAWQSCLMGLDQQI